MRTVTKQEWKALYAVWRVPYMHLEQKERGAIVRGCAGKALYDSEDEARRIAHHLPSRHGMRISVYPCDICGAFHIGNTRKRGDESTAGQINGIRFPADDDLKRLIYHMAKKHQANHVVAGGKDGEIGHCTRCGRGLNLGGPQSLSVVVAAMKAFAQDHATCKSGGFSEPIPQSPDEWLVGRDTGISSRTIYSVMQHRVMPRYGIPQDPDDFGRCYRLLKLFPAWHRRLHEVSSKYPEWTPLVDNWDELTALYEEELPAKTAPKLYARMKELIHG